MTILVSFLNVGKRLPSSIEQFLLFGENVEENSNADENFLYLLLKDLKYLESKVFEVENAPKKVLPNGMKMLSFLAGELSNSAAYFTTFANVNQIEVNDYKKSFGIPSQHPWRSFPYSKRVSDASKATKKNKLLGKKICQIQQI